MVVLVLFHMFIKDAYEYHYNLWLAQQKNKDVEIQLYTPKVKEIVIPKTAEKLKKRPIIYIFR